MEKKRKQQWLMRGGLVLGGVLTGLCVSFPVIGALEWLSLVPAVLTFFVMVRDGGVSYPRLWRAGFLYFYSFSLVIFHWFFYMYPMDFTELSHPQALGVVLVAWLGLSLLQAIAGAFLPVLLGCLSRGQWMRRHSFLQVPLLAALWCIREWIQTLYWTGVPWGRLALGQAAVPAMLQTAQWFGSYLITFVLVAFNGTVAWILLHPERLRFGAAVAASLLLFQCGAGVALTLREEKREPIRTVRVAVIQGNIGSADKWDMSVSDTFDIYYEWTRQAALAGAKLITWPESAVPVTLEDYPSYRRRLEDLAVGYGVTLMLGMFAPGETDAGYYNSILVVTPEGEWLRERYDKQHLVPFGEYVPMRKLVMALLPALGNLSQLSSDVIPGKESVVFPTGVGDIGALICFDSIYEELARNSVRNGAQLLLISTNDSWFYDSAAVKMHCAQAQLRAIETGRSVVRAASTGISALMTPTGKITLELGALQEGMVVGEVELYAHRTLYSRVGNLWVWFCLSGVVLAGGLRVAERICQRKRRGTRKIQEA